ncbi:zinc transport system ATP-binding protein [Paenibacillaceae bacterium GAS479]|nr:zinc transport system ATP-binding protein [Paenibacillaceae bacterium GAS479]
MLLASLKEVEFGYNDKPSLHNATIEVHSSEFVAVTGPNGASKTTLLKLMLGLLKPWKGKAYLAPKRDDGRKLTVSYVPQQIAAFNGGFPSNVYEFVLSGCWNRGSWLRRITADDRALAEKSLRQVGMWQLRERRIGELSGGQKQRICIARALAQRPDLLVMDEPTTGMDEESRRGFYELMRHMVEIHGMSIVMVTHGLEECRPYLDRIIELERKGEGGWKCCTTTLCNEHSEPVL